MGKLEAREITAEEGSYRQHPPWKCKDKDVRRWNKEWARYLLRGFDIHLAPHTDYPDTPALPADPMGFIDLSFGHGSPLGLYCDREHVEGKNVMEMGCGCGNLGKLISRYAKTYLGTDYSTLALKVARLVSPDNCTYIHLADADALAAKHGTIDTILCRHFWIHQNLEMGRWILEFMMRFLEPGGRIYADFFWETEDKGQDLLVLRPTSAVPEKNPSATYRYEPDDIQALIKGFPLKIVREDFHKKMQRRYNVFERTK